jgi:predicted cobalt transporter CbtA
MYRTYGFTNDRSAIAVVLSGIARYFTVVAMPIIGLSAVLITGHGNLQQLVWLVALSTAFGVALWVLRRLVDSTAFAHRLGSWLQRLATRVIRLFRRTPPENLQASVVEFSDRSRAVAEGHFTRIAV